MKKKRKKALWKWLGRPGHFICADRCRFHLHTEIGKYCISTVGLFFRTPDDEKPTTVGSDRLYETMVFNLRDRKERWDNVDFAGYNDLRKAEKGHLKMCVKYSKLIERRRKC